MSFGNEDQNNSKNFIIAMVLFMVVMFGYEYFSGDKNQNSASQTTEEIITDKETSQDKEIPYNQESELPQEKLSIDDALKATNRISLENTHMIGSVNLNGGIIDSIILKDYKDSVDKDSKNVMLLTPKDTEHQFYYAISYNDNTNNESISEKSVWTSDDFEGRQQSITLKTQTQNGLIIERTVTFDDNYLINIKDKIINVSSKPIELNAKSDLIRFFPKHNDYAIVHEGLVGCSEAKVQEIKYKDIENKTGFKNCSWLGYTDIYWLIAVINSKNNIVNYSTFGDDCYKISSSKPRNLRISPDTMIELKYQLFTGPKDIQILKNYKNERNFEKFDMAIDFGWFFIITKPLIQLVDLLAKIFSNMGIVILVLTLMFKVVTYPLMKKSFISAAKMKEIQPKIASLQKLYANDKVRMNQEMMALYKKEQVSPMSGCLPMLLQAPIFFCLYKVFFISIEMRQAPLFGWVHDLSAPDSLYIFNLFGAINWTPPNFLQIGVWPLIMGLSMFLQQKFTTIGKKKKIQIVEKTSEQKMQENMMLIMPIMFTYICSSFPVAVVIYWTISNIFGMLQQYYVNRRIK